LRLQQATRRVLRVRLDEFLTRQRPRQRDREQRAESRERQRAVTISVCVHDCLSPAQFIHSKLLQLFVSDGQKGTFRHALILERFCDRSCILKWYVSGFEE
jgi:hypothetical protein